MIDKNLADAQKIRWPIVSAKLVKVSCRFVGYPEVIQIGICGSVMISRLVVWAEALRRTAEVLRKILHRMDVGTNRVLSVVATLEFIQHQLPEMGHSNLLVTQTLHGQHAVASAAPAA
jgi:hypothetical protein